MKKLRDAMKTEEAYRMDSAVSEVLEGLREGFRVHGLGSYIRYFCKETVSFLNYFPVDELTIFLDEPLRLKEKAETTETEFRESMSHRLEGGFRGRLPSSIRRRRRWRWQCVRALFYCWGWIRSSPA